MERSDWTPAVLITATIALVTAGLVWLVMPWDTGRGSDTGTARPRHRPAARVAVWIGEVAPGLKAVLAPVWGDLDPDRYHDGRLNEDLGLDGPRALQWYRLLVFNIAPDPQTLVLDDGRLVMVGEEKGQHVRLRSLAAMAQRGEVALDPSLAFALRSLGALTERIEIPAGRYAKLLVSFEEGPGIETVRAVATKDGSTLRRRRISQAAFRRLVEDPDELQVKDL